MSYILEALKKIERRRQLEVSPTSLSGLGTPETAAPKRPLWPYLLAAALILNTGVLFWWIVFRGPYQPPRSAAILPQRTSVKTVPMVAQPSPAAKTARPAPAEKRPQPPADPKVPEDRKAPVPATARPTVNEPVKAAPSPQAKKGVSRSDQVFNLNELPAEIKGALPSLKVSAHVYSPDPAARLVRVNEMLLQEGQDLPEGLKVEEILPNGVIFRFQGTRFRIGIQGN